MSEEQREVRYVAQYKCGHDTIEYGVFEWRKHGVALNKVCFLPVDCVVLFGLCQLEHLARDIQPDDSPVAVEFSGCGESQITRSRA